MFVIRSNDGWLCHLGIRSPKIHFDSIAFGTLGCFTTAAGISFEFLNFADIHRMISASESSKIGHVFQVRTSRLMMQSGGGSAKRVSAPTSVRQPYFLNRAFVS